MIQKCKNIYHLIVAYFWCLFYRFPSRHLTVIGVTGTDGKTTTTTLIYEALKACGMEVSMISTVHAEIAGKTYDTGFHVTSPNPRDIQKFFRKAVDAHQTYFVLETTSHAIDQNRVFGVTYSIGVLTNITHEHLDYHRTFEAYKQTKFQLLLRCPICVIPYDDVSLYKEMKELLRSKHVISYGLNPKADISSYTLNMIPSLPGDYNMKNSLAAIAVIDALQLNRKKAINVIEKFKGIQGRMEVLQLSPFRTIVDFAHTPNALHEVLQTVKKTTKKRLIHVFGSAGLRDVSKRPLMGKEADTYADMIILTEEDYRTENPNDILSEIESGISNIDKITKIISRKDAIIYAFTQAKKGDTVIITGKGHEKSLCRGNIEYPWNDSEFVRSYLHV
jgi:UDP-N-acetylmuramoyl-L-alanyl-D-glutamate--2,6-diaminopimelate ligase